MLIKVSSKDEYLKEICEGKVYMNESGYFRKLEDNYRGDRFDGKCPVDLGKTKTDSLTIFNPQNPEERVEIPAEAITNFTLGFSGDDKIPLFCCTQVDEKILYKKQIHNGGLRKNLFQKWNSSESSIYFFIKSNY